MGNFELRQNMGIGSSVEASRLQNSYLVIETEPVCFEKPPQMLSQYCHQLPVFPHIVAVKNITKCHIKDLACSVKNEIVTETFEA